MKYRPVSTFHLPPGLETEWVELPRDHPNPHVFPNIPSSNHPFGLFTTNRPLTNEEMRDYEIEEII